MSLFRERDQISDQAIELIWRMRQEPGTVDVLGNKWSTPIVRNLITKGPCTFSEYLESPEHVSTSILAARLRCLTPDGLALWPAFEELGKSPDPTTEPTTKIEPEPTAKPEPTTAPEPTAKPAPVEQTCDTAKAVSGPAVDTKWGPVQVSATIANGEVCEVHAVVWPDSDSKSAAINATAIPKLDARASADGVEFDNVSGATFTSDGYRTSLQRLLDSL